MVKFRFEMVMEYPDYIHPFPDDMYPEDILKLARKSITEKIQSMSLNDLKPVSSTIDVVEIGERLTVTLNQCGFMNCGTFHNLLEDISYTHFLRDNERITIETAPSEDSEIIEAVMGGLEKEEGQLPCRKKPRC